MKQKITTRKDLTNLGGKVKKSSIVSFILKTPGASERNNRSI